MNKFKDFLKIRKLKKEIKKHDKSYIDKKCILIDTPLSSLGTYKVKIKLHKKVEFNINIKLIK